MRLWQVGATYTLAFLAGMAGVWVGSALGFMTLLEGVSDSGAVAMLLPALAGLCVFSLVYGLGSARMLKWRFWVFAPLMIGAVILASMEAVMRGFVTPFEGFSIAVMSVFVAGFFLCLKRDYVPDAVITTE